MNKYSAQTDQSSHKNVLYKVIYTVICSVFALSVLVMFGTTTEQINNKLPTKGLKDQNFLNKVNYQVSINKPKKSPVVVLEETDFHGRPLTASCTTCHSTRQPNNTLNDSSKLDEFHPDLILNHGQLSCMSCHNAGDYDKLKLANGQTLDYTNVMQLCAQCHGPQHRDYQNGSHGGMQGYWDLSKGPRVRNNCTDCHNPHTPAFQKFRPVFPPDRDLTQEHSFLIDVKSKSIKGNIVEIQENE
ncbi:hypothetical protein JD969_10735 [Planctomycetota bacterium]|nr:hypothetical protein JD969_10735 [Planctomycetota bacterium]